MCLTHGKLATELFKSSWVVNQGSGKKQYKKLWYWQCDLNPSSGLKQTRLSFVKKPAADVKQGDQNTRGGDNTSSFSTPSRGQ